MSPLYCARCGTLNDEQVTDCHICGQPLHLNMPTGTQEAQQQILHEQLIPQPRPSRRKVLATIAGGAVLLPLGAYLTYKAFIDPYILTYSGHAGRVQSATWTPDGKQVASIGASNTIQLWDPLTGTTVRTYTLEKETTSAMLLQSLPLQSVVWSLDGKQLLALVMLQEGTASSGIIVQVACIQVWNVATGQRVRSFPVMQPEKSQSADQANSTIYRAVLNEQYLAVAKMNETDGNTTMLSFQMIEIWDVATGQVIASFDKKAHGLDTQVQHMAWAPDQRTLATISPGKARMGSVLQIWDAPTGQQIRSLSLPFAQEAAWLPDGKSVAPGLDVYNVQTGNVTATYHLDQDSPINVVAWSPDGKRIAVTSTINGYHRWMPLFDTISTRGSYTGVVTTLFILNASDGRLVARYEPAQDDVKKLVWSPDGKYLLVLGRDIEVWRVG